MADRYPVRIISPDEFEAFSAVPNEAFLVTWPAEAIETERRVTEWDRTIAAFDGSQMVGTGTSYSFQLTVPGSTAGAAGISAISVLPSHRRRGVLTGMMQYLLSDAISHGEPLAILFASETAIYGRHGFGLATWQQRFQIRRGEGTLVAGPAAAGSGEPQLRSAEASDVQAELAQVYQTLLAGRPGMLARDDRWWGYLLADTEFRRSGMSPRRCLLAEDESGPRGYALYRTKPEWGNDGLPDGTLRISELMALDPATAAALWADLLNRDLVGEVIANMRPVDDPLLAMLTDQRRARPSIGDGLWVRLTDLPTALCQRSYAGPVDLVLEVADPVMPGNAGRWRLQAGGPDEDGKATCERTTAPADLNLPVQALGAGYLGGARLGQLAAAGWIEEVTSGAVARLSAAMAWDPAPWASTMF